MEEQLEHAELELNHRGKSFTVVIDTVRANELLNGKSWDKVSSVNYFRAP